MKLSDFQFELPQSLLAQRPAADRDESRLMVLDRKNESIAHHTFKEVLNFFEEGDVMVLNNTKVFQLVYLVIKKKLEHVLKFSYFVNLMKNKDYGMF